MDDVPGLPLEVTVDLTNHNNSIINNDNISQVDWFYDDTLTNPIITPTNFTASNATYFILAINPKSMCTNTAKVKFLVNFTPQVSFTSSKVCEGFRTSFSNNTISLGDTTNPKTVWNFSNGTFSNLFSPEYIFMDPGIHTVSLTVSNNKKCTEFYTANIEVFANPIASFSMNPNPTTMINSTVNFTNESILFTTVDTFKWNFGGISSSLLQDPTYSFSEDTIGKHVINLEVTDQNGCKNSSNKILTILGSSGFYMPSAFSPNGDGLNDVFIPNGFGILDKGYRFLIFNRWGDLIFESNNQNIGWDGTFKDTSLQTETYVWKLHFLDFEEISHSKVGRFNLVK